MQTGRTVNCSPTSGKETLSQGALQLTRFNWLASTDWDTGYHNSTGDVITKLNRFNWMTCQISQFNRRRWRYHRNDSISSTDWHAGYHNSSLFSKWLKDTQATIQMRQSFSFENLQIFLISPFFQPAIPQQLAHKAVHVCLQVRSLGFKFPKKSSN